MNRRLVLAPVVVLFCSSAAFASCEQQLNSAQRKVDSTSATCERSLSKVTQMETTKADSLDYLRTRENQANILEPTDSVSCAIAEVFGECSAKKRRRRFVEELNRREAYYNRRIVTQQNKANRDCAKAILAVDKLQAVVGICTPK